MIHKNHFPENSYNAPEIVKNQLQKVPWKSYHEQDTIFNILSWQWYLLIKGITPKILPLIESLPSKPHPREALLLWTKQDFDNESVWWDIYVHKKTGKYYKFQHTQ